MANIWQYIRNLFQEAEDSSPSNPAIHTVIERTEDEKEAFQGWKTSLIKHRLIAWLSDQYAMFRVLPEDIDEGLDFLDSPSSKGFAIHFYKTNYNRREVTYFFDYLKEQIRNLDYKVQLSDSRTYNRQNWVETVERYYLKPRPNFEKGKKMDQRFGNVTIELELRDDKVHQLRLQATTYRDRMYSQAEDFRDLMQAVLQ